ncbi:MAG: hypothetical protein IKY98_03640 [Alphaproteobacteria bacterium]|nr:hypothetical protein [Alphaproteobacteria bacterium]
MLRKQLKKSEQISPAMSIVYDYDQPFTKRMDFLNAFKQALGEDCGYFMFGKHTVYYYDHDGKREYFLVAAITWLSGPHLLFKKRLQLKKWYKEFYDLYCNEVNSKIHLTGIYHYDGLVVFIEFATEDYMGNKMNSSAAHVYSNDIYQALTNKKFEKIDKNNNHITTIASRNYKAFLDGTLKENSLFDFFRKFNLGFTFGQWITAIEAITEMKTKNWYQWRGTEWAGWLLECKVNEFIEMEKYQDQVMYIGNRKGLEFLDLDLLFKKESFYGDLKASDITTEETPGNDQKTVLEALAKCGRIWYIIYEHETIKDKDKDNEMAKARMKLLGVPYKEGDKISYQSRMKHSVNFKRMKIFELNRINMYEALKEFNQGHQPNGGQRAPKFSINKKNIDNFIVFSYEK